MSRRLQIRQIHRDAIETQTRAHRRHAHRRALEFIGESFGTLGGTELSLLDFGAGDGDGHGRIARLENLEHIDPTRISKTIVGARGLSKLLANHFTGVNQSLEGERVHLVKALGDAKWGATRPLSVNELTFARFLEIDLEKPGVGNARHS